jgi:hypothetical protein
MRRVASSLHPPRPCGAAYTHMYGHWVLTRDGDVDGGLLLVRVEREHATGRGGDAPGEAGEVRVVVEPRPPQQVRGRVV